MEIKYIDKLVRFMKYIEYTFDNVELNLEASSEKLALLNTSKIIEAQTEDDLVDQLALYNQLAIN